MYLQKQYWGKTPKIETIPAEESQLNNPDSQYFEKAPKGLPVGIQIQNITKVFLFFGKFIGVECTVILKI